MKKLQKDRILLLSFFSAFAICSHIFDSLLPKPFPFLRLGFANIPILIFVAKKEFFFAIVVALSKSIVSPVLLGTIFSIQPLFSLAGSLVSVVLMASIYRIVNSFSIVGISIVGAVSNNIVQICLAYLILFNTKEIFRLLPLMIVFAIVSGGFVGYIAKNIGKRLFKQGLI